MLKQEQGILLLALSHPYYGRMAYNLAMSIKAVDTSVDITLVYTEDAIAHINNRNMWVFDNKVLYEPTSEPFGVKMQLYDLSPYERTLYIDVDTLWVNKQSPAKLFEQLKGIPFTGITEGFHDYDNPANGSINKTYPTWADLEEIKQEFPLESWANDKEHIIYQWRGEFIYFEKCEATDDLFSLMRAVYTRAGGMKTVKKFADNIPDELAINIATAVYSLKPHKFKWKPTYWDRLNGSSMPDIAALQQTYYVISCGSNANGSALKRVYNRLCAAAAYKLKLQHVFPLVSKKEMIITRQLM
jgi:hypothetical protein